MADLGKLTRLRLEGFKSIRSLDLELRDLNILIGANGAGKSNFVSFFRFMNKLAKNDLSLYVKQNGNADRFLHFGQKITSRIGINLSFASICYGCTLLPSIEGDFLIANETPHLNRRNLTNTERLEGIGGHELDWGIHHFHDVGRSAKVKGLGRIHDILPLRENGENLAAFLAFVKAAHLDAYQDIVRTITRVAPFFHDFILEPEPENNDYIRLRWKHVGTDAYFDAHDLSDGTLRFICLATLLLQPNPPATILLDEPELGLHPYAVELLAGMMRSAAARTQVIAATQSVTLANQFGPEDLIVVDRVDNASVFRRLKEAEVADWLDQYRMGDLWQKNLIGGTP